MPELPDVTVYVERLTGLLQGHALTGIRLVSPFLLRTVDPPIRDLNGRTLQSVDRIGKRMVLGFDDDLFLVIHLMIAGRLRWRPEGAKRTARNAVALLDFDNGTILFTEASKKKRASLHVVRGRDALRDFDRGGIDVFSATPAAFADILRAERHTLKRSLTDPRWFDGIGGAYSDEILHHAGLSPIKMSDTLTDDEIERLAASTVTILAKFTEAIRAEVGDGFPETVTAFRKDMAVHGRYGKNCPVCDTPVQRIVYAENETNYCPTCQTDGRLLADRALSQLLKKDWPKTLAELEEMKRG